MEARFGTAAPPHVSAGSGDPGISSGRLDFDGRHGTLENDVHWDLAVSCGTFAASCGTWPRPLGPGWHRPVEQVLLFVDICIQSIPLESLMENDATGGAHMDRPTRELFYGLKTCSRRKLAKIQK